MKLSSMMDSVGVYRRNAQLSKFHLKQYALEINR